MRRDKKRQPVGTGCRSSPFADLPICRCDAARARGLSRPEPMPGRSPDLRARSRPYYARACSASAIPL
ncbi:hypothetical protein C7S16_1353 [Burkholderia thailandensis]|uniref:Uncharacterized protein n=1 Tax=Burkholderia thailandensis TaxID=57975 RepID=A0AAW9CV01_BURTH|nr:hypothetical protein [Burkholderia thailandensis]